METKHLVRMNNCSLLVFDDATNTENQKLETLGLGPCIGIIMQGSLFFKGNENHLIQKAFIGLCHFNGLAPANEGIVYLTNTLPLQKALMNRFFKNNLSDDFEKLERIEIACVGLIGGEKQYYSNESDDESINSSCGETDSELDAKALRSIFCDETNRNVFSKNIFNTYFKVISFSKNFELMDNFLLNKEKKDNYFDLVTYINNENNLIIRMLELEPMEGPNYLIFKTINFEHGKEIEIIINEDKTVQTYGKSNKKSKNPKTEEQEQTDESSYSNSPINLLGNRKENKPIIGEKRKYSPTSKDFSSDQEQSDSEPAEKKFKNNNTNK